jgi:hypothetical protein
VDGVVAQLVERLVRNEKVRGSTPLGSTMLSVNNLGIKEGESQQQVTTYLPVFVCVLDVGFYSLRL